MDDEKWELLDDVSGPFHAELIRGLLEAQEIPVLLVQEGVGRAVGLTVGPLGDVQILVPSVEIDRAKKILDDYYKGRFIEDVSFEEDDESEDED